MFLQVDIIHVEWKLGVIFLFADPGSWALRFACPKIEEAELVPYQPPYMGFDGREPILSAVSV